jgi:hypothetical protein
MASAFGSLVEEFPEMFGPFGAFGPVADVADKDAVIQAADRRLSVATQSTEF